MTDFYTDMQKIASDVLGEFKQGVVQYVELAAVAGATPDDPGEPTETVTTVNAAVRPVSTKYVDGSHIVQSDKQIVMPGDSVVPSITGNMRIDGADYKIIEIMPRPAAGTPVSFTVIVRR